MSARHWSSAIWTHVEPAPVIVGPIAATAGREESPSSPATRATTPPPRTIRIGLAEPPVHVVGGAGVVGVAEDLRGRARLDDAAGLALVHVEERAAVGDALRLLHVVGDDHD